MEIGAIGFHKEKDRKIIKDIRKDNTIVNKLNKTKKEEYPNL